MKITDTTPKPERTFTIELTENELKNITLIIGQEAPYNTIKMIKENHWAVEVLGEMTYCDSFYDTFKDALANK
jgi:hypothetical protein